MEERANIVEDKIVIPGRELNNFDEIGFTWDDLIPQFQKFGMDKLVLIEQECVPEKYYTQMYYTENHTVKITPRLNLLHHHKSVVGMSFILNAAKYRDFNNVPKLRREQLKRSYKPNPNLIKRIAGKASIPLEIQKTNDDMIVEARLKYIEENEVRFF